ncbi:MAG TPA: pyridoxamine 5'-phosphate oxidase family protein [Acidimicrobiales bacterium]|nr:pyridoxamine 5'-phosphate oxidase family protein [Acidimicrobiales bacterium]
MPVHEAWLEELPPDECDVLLRAGSVGRVAFVVGDFPVIVPVNYQVVSTTQGERLALRTREGGLIDEAPISVAFEIDGIDPLRRQGWSVLVRGALRHASPEEVLQPPGLEPWVDGRREVIVLIEPYKVTGRRLHAASSGWPFHLRAYL